MPKYGDKKKRGGGRRRRQRHREASESSSSSLAHAPGFLVLSDSTHVSHGQAASMRSGSGTSSSSSSSVGTTGVSGTRLFDNVIDAMESSESRSHPARKHRRHRKSHRSSGSARTAKRRGAPRRRHRRHSPSSESSSSSSSAASLFPGFKGGSSSSSSSSSSPQWAGAVRGRSSSGSSSGGSMSSSSSRHIALISTGSASEDGSESSASTYLKRPNTRKHLSSGEHGRASWALGWMQGWRNHQEDAHNVELNLDSTSDSSHELHLFAVYDGHGGDEVSHLCEEKLPRRIRRNLSKRSRRKRRSSEAIKDAMRDAILSLDRDLRRDAFSVGDNPGSTAVMAVVAPKEIVVANVGDSRCIVSRSGKMVEMTHDHTCDLPAEKRRINSAGVEVESDSGEYRVMGLAMSRSIGDVEHKSVAGLPRSKQPVIADPEFKTVPMDKHNDFMICACDGIFEAYTNKQVFRFVKRKLDKGVTPVDVCAQLLDRCLAPIGEPDAPGHDNMSVIIVDWRNHSS